MTDKNWIEITVQKRIVRWELNEKLSFINFKAKD
ncbi:MAG: hypothetical protein ACD_3C00086G0002 [uncultured bacterium (gcode 4)]|uniref:Uncharacterized protein n=1 Tax=uncultured bacterium (gcode 4) TaxID=1234023 RepID=K2FZ14_9BACT|nr:MAG: hypothetical protein ACD_3C00086G0002 [uncultured bacterium (gcode 4)]